MITPSPHHSIINIPSHHSIIIIIIHHDHHDHLPLTTLHRSILFCSLPGLQEADTPGSHEDHEVGNRHCVGVFICCDDDDNKDDVDDDDDMMMVAMMMMMMMMITRMMRIMMV